MDTNDRHRFIAALTGLEEYYGKPLSPAVIGLYWEALARFDLDALLKAIGQHMSSPDGGQFMPKIADLVRIIEGSGEDASMLAWSKFDHAVRYIGPYADVVFDDPIIHRVVADMGGWIAFGEKTNDDWPFLAKEFQTRYRGYRNRGGELTYAKQLIGITNAHNVPAGYAAESPVLIGNVDKAQKVLAGGATSSALPIKRILDLVPKLKPPEVL